MVFFRFQKGSFFPDILSERSFQIIKYSPTDLDNLKYQNLKMLF